MTEETGNKSNSPRECISDLGGRENNYGELLSKYRDVASTLFELSKLPALFGALFGVFYLFSYTVTEGIPFPIELSVLPTLMVAVGFVTLTFVLIIVTAVLLPAMVQTDASNIEYLELFAVRHEENSNVYVQPRKIKQRIVRYLFACFLPTGLAIVITWHLFVNALPTGAGIVGILVGVGVVAGISLWCTRGAGDGEKRLLETSETRHGKARHLFFLLLLMNLLSALSFFVFIFTLMMAFPELLSDGTSIANRYPVGTLISLWIAFAVVNFTSFVPTARIGKILRDSPDGIERIELGTPLPIISMIIVGIVVASTVLAPSVSHKLGGAALRTLGIGGGLEQTLCFDDGAVAKSLQSALKLDNSGCARKLKILFDAGDRVNVKLADNSAQIYAIRKDQIVFQSRHIQEAKTK